MESKYVHQKTLIVTAREIRKLFISLEILTLTKDEINEFNKVKHEINKHLKKKVNFKLVKYKVCKIFIYIKIVKYKLCKFFY